MEVIEVKEAAASTVNVTTEFIQGTMFNDVTVSADNDAIATYKLFANFNGESKALHAEAVTVGETAKGLFVSNGEEVTVKFFDAEGMEVAETTVKVGESTSFELEEKEVKEYAITTEFVQGTMFNDVAVTCEDAEVASFQVFANFNGEMKALHGEPVANGETAKGLFVSKGEEVTVKLFDAEGNVLGQVKAEL
jgi:GMP synthase PP-ATPase subunit